MFSDAIVDTIDMPVPAWFLDRLTEQASACLDQVEVAPELRSGQRFIQLLCMILRTTRTDYDGGRPLWTLLGSKGRQIVQWLERLANNEPCRDELEATRFRADCEARCESNLGTSQFLRAESPSRCRYKARRVSALCAAVIAADVENADLDEFDRLVRAVGLSEDTTDLDDRLAELRTIYSIYHPQP